MGQHDRTLLSGTGLPAPTPAGGQQVIADSSVAPATLVGALPGYEDSLPASGPATPAPPPVIPDVVIEAELGRGGMGVVYKGRQPYLERNVAVKLLLLGSGGDAQDFLKRFQREAKILAGLSHPHIVGCYQAGSTAAGEPYLVMEFIDGTDLRKYINQHGHLSIPAALRITAEIAEALGHAHAKGIIHRDVKPENVLLAKRDHAPADDPFPWIGKLVDLGLARPQKGLKTGSGMDLTVQGAVLGTPATMAPEQFDDPDAVDYRADIYGLGCVLYHALTGSPAFTGRTLAQLVTSKVNGPAPDPRVLKSDLPPGVGALVTSLLAKDKAKRPQSYAEIAARCRELAGSAPGAKRSPLLLVGVAVAVVAVLVGIVATMAGGGKAVPTVPAPAAMPAPAVAAVTPAPVAPAAVPAPAVPTGPRTWGKPRALLEFDHASQLSGWAKGPEAVWVSSEEIEGAATGQRGAITRPLTRPDVRFAGTWAIAKSSAKFDTVRAGVVLKDGSSVVLNLANLGGIYNTSVMVFKDLAAGSFPVTAAGPISVAPVEEVAFIIESSDRKLTATVDGRSFISVDLVSPPTALVLQIIGKVPVSVKDLTESLPASP